MFRRGKMTCLTSSFRDTKCTRNGVGGAKEVQNLNVMHICICFACSCFPKAILVRNNTFLSDREINYY